MESGGNPGGSPGHAASLNVNSRKPVKVNLGLEVSMHQLYPRADEGRSPDRPALGLKVEVSHLQFSEVKFQGINQS